MKLITLIFSCFSLVIFSSISLAELHPWTDLQGRTLQASFIKSDGVTVTINWNGSVVPIPLSTLSAESQALAKRLSAPSASTKSSNPFDTIAPPSALTLHPWTDLQGRTLQAAFVKLGPNSVTVNWQGREVPLPLASLNPASQALARKLSGGGAPKSSSLQKSVVPLVKKVQPPSP